MLPSPEIPIHVRGQDLQKNHVVLRNFAIEDVDDFLEWATDDEVTKHLLWNSYHSKNDAEDFFLNVIAKHSWFKAICLDQKVIGSITLDKWKGAHSCKAELGYVIARRYWGKSYASQAVKEALKAGFDDLDIQRIEAFVDPDNIASRKVLENCSFVREGYLRNYIMHKGKLRDRWLFAMTRQDHQP
jgi:[ribosomal protein S5]-alanine N-acetyltransferase